MSFAIGFDVEGRQAETSITVSGVEIVSNLLAAENEIINIYVDNAKKSISDFRREASETQAERDARMKERE